MKTLLIFLVSFYYFLPNSDCQSYIKKEILPLQFKGEVISKEIKKDETVIIVIKNKKGDEEKYILNLKLINDGGFSKKLQKGNWAIKEKGEESFKIAIINTSQSAEIITYQVKCK